MLELPPAAKTALDTYHIDTRPKVMIGLPQMLTSASPQVLRLFEYASNKSIRLEIAWRNECRHHDYARNVLVADFLKSHCEWLLQIDADVEPNPRLMDLIKFNKDVISGNVFCYVAGELMPSIWERAPCEQCKNVKEFQDKGTIIDEKQYGAVGDILMRWNPFRSDYEAFYMRGRGGVTPPVQSSYMGKSSCRCQGTGFDPFVFRVHRDVVKDSGPIRVDSVGAASLFIHRRVFERVKPPWFCFLYKQNREILLTEDHYFCWKAQEEGFEIWADQTMGCEHYKSIGLLAMHRLISRAYEKGIEEGKKQAQAKEATSC